MDMVPPGPPARSRPTTRQTAELERLQPLVDLIKAAYLDERDQWAGAVAGNCARRAQLHPKWEKCWLKLARILEHEAIDPAVWMRAQFHGGNLVYPNQTYGTEAARRYKDYVRFQQTDPLDELNSEMEAFHLSVLDCRGWCPHNTEPQLWLMVISQEPSNLSPLFRYCLAYAEGWHHVAAPLEERAGQQFKLNADRYIEVWGELLPPTLRQYAQQQRGTHGR